MYSPLRATGRRLNLRARESDMLKNLIRAVEDYNCIFMEFHSGVRKVSPEVQKLNDVIFNLYSFKETNGDKYTSIFKDS